MTDDEKSKVQKGLKKLFAAYRTLPVEMVLDTAGDLTARFVVRMKEIFESSRIIRSVLDNLPSGELTAKMPRRSGMSARRRAQTAAVDHGESVMKCWSAW